MRPFCLAMAGPSPPDPTPTPRKRAKKLAPNPDDNRPRKVATWAAVVGPIVSQVLGGGVILYEVLNEVNNPAALGAGLTLAIGGKTADVIAELLKRG